MSELRSDAVPKILAAAREILTAEEAARLAVGAGLDWEDLDVGQRDQMLHHLVFDGEVWDVAWHARFARRITRSLAPDPGAARAFAAFQSSTFGFFHYEIDSETGHHSARCAAGDWHDAHALARRGASTLDRWADDYCCTMCDGPRPEDPAEVAACGVLAGWVLLDERGPSVEAYALGHAPNELRALFQDPVGSRRLRGANLDCLKYLWWPWTARE